MACLGLDQEARAEGLVRRPHTGNAVHPIHAELTSVVESGWRGEQDEDRVLAETRSWSRSSALPALAFSETVAANHAYGRDALIEIARMRDDDWQTLRELRLRALAEAPYAFWATRADEVTYTEAQWRQFLRAATWYVARRDGQLVGLAAGLLRQETPDEPELIAMWVAPTERGRGTGTLLAEEIMAWARGRGATAMTLWVTDGNTAARRLYQRVGFNTTGERGPFPHSAAAGMERMRILLD